MILEPDAEPRTERRDAARVVVPLVVAGAALGAAAGWLWYRWWGPPNRGSIYDTEAWGPRWIDLSDQGLAHQFDATAQYAVIGLVAGALLGVLGYVLSRRGPLAAVAGLVVGAALGAALCWAVGSALSPSDPQDHATEANVCTAAPCKEYPAAIDVSGWTPFLCWPLGALGCFSASVALSGWLGSTRDRLDELPPLTMPPAGAPPVRERDDQPAP